jgi:hypothetical protein
MLLVGYCYGIRSERRLCEEVHLNLAYRWFCRLGLEGEVPDHSTFSKNRHGRFRDCDLLRKLFETVVQRCIAEGLVDGAAFAVDASLIAADANKQRAVAGTDEVDWETIARTRRSVREYLDTLDEAAWGAASDTVPKFIAKSDPAAGQQPTAYKGAQDTDDQIADDPKSGPAHDLTGQPACNDVEVLGNKGGYPDGLREWRSLKDFSNDVVSA